MRITISAGKINIDSDKVMERVKSKVSSIKNFVIRHKRGVTAVGLAAVLAGTYVLGSFAANKNNKTVYVTVQELLDMNADNLGIDEGFYNANDTVRIETISTESLIDDEPGYYTDGENYDELVETQFGCALMTLEEYLNIINEIIAIGTDNLSEVPSITDSTIAGQLLGMSNEEALELINTYSAQVSAGNVSTELVQKIKFLFDFCNAWIQENGIFVAESAVERTIKMNACEAVGISPAKWDCFVIDSNYDLVYYDPVVGEKLVCEGDKKINKAISQYDENQRFARDIPGFYIGSKEAQIIKNCNASINIIKELCSCRFELNGNRIESHEVINLENGYVVAREPELKRSRVRI